MKEFISGDGIELLGLSRRAYNTLMRAGITQIGQVVQMTEQDLLLVRNLGTTVIAEIVLKLQTAGLELKLEPIPVSQAGSSSLPENAPSERLADSMQIRWLQIVAQMKSELEVNRLHPRALILERPISDWLECSIPVGKAVAQSMLQALEAALSLKTIADELDYIFVCSGESSETKLEVFVERHQRNKLTLEEIGISKKITRERVRQIANRTEQRFSECMANNPFVRIQSGPTLLVAEDMGDEIRYQKWLRNIGNSGRLWCMKG